MLAPNTMPQEHSYYADRQYRYKSYCTVWLHSPEPGIRHYLGHTSRRSMAGLVKILTGPYALQRLKEIFHRESLEGITFKLSKGSLQLDEIDGKYYGVYFGGTILQESNPNHIGA